MGLPVLLDQQDELSTLSQQVPLFHNGPQDRLSVITETYYVNFAIVPLQVSFLFQSWISLLYSDGLRMFAFYIEVQMW